MILVMEFVESLTLDSLVTLQSDVEPYVLDWPAAEPGSVAEALVLVTHIRPGGFLAAVPVGFIPEEVLAVGNSSQRPGPVGPSTVIVVPGSMLDNGTLVPVGSPVSVVVVDFSQDVLPQLHPLPVASDLHFTFDPDQPYAVPTPLDLLSRIQEWLEAGGDSGLGYATAGGEDIDGVPLEEEDFADATPGSPLSAVPKLPTKSRKAKPTVPGPGRPTSAEKRPTVASLASSLQELIQVNSGLTQQIQSLSLRQQQLERRATPPPQTLATPQTLLSQPLSSALVSQSHQPSAVAKAIGTPPRTSAGLTPGLLRSPLIQPPELTELEEEKLEIPRLPRALTALVSQIASQSSDPLLDLGGGSFGASTRGAQGRAKLQAELAAQRGSFFSSVLTAMARRMQPTSSAEGTPEELMAKGVSGSRYLERFGGFGKHRELGCLQHQVMTIMDFLQVGNLQAARDSTALLAVTIDQAALDNGRFDLANVLCLQEEPPSTVFSHKPANVLSRTRAFTPLASQQWITVALAYIKELDVITTKRLELSSQTKQNTFAASSAPPDNPRPKPNPKRKGKAGGKWGSSAPAQQQEPED